MMNASFSYNSLLSRIREPADLMGLDAVDLEFLAKELRARIIDTVSRTGGHLASSLGVVELTIALLRVFNPKTDKIIWDVGHQAYAYKILTGRNERFDTLRQFGGISGFPKMAESPYDHFGVGHSSTSLSAALGMARALELTGQGGHVVSVIGDGALTAGMVYEAMNHAGGVGRPCIMVLNDNQMSISKNVGALSNFFSRKTSARWVRMLKREIGDFLSSIPGIGEDVLELAKRSKDGFKSFISPGMLFEALRFKYLGPVNGHDTARLEEALTLAAGLERPVVVHVLTQKGKGYSPAESDPANYHGIGRFNPRTGDVANPDQGRDFMTYTQVFSESMCEIAANDKKLVGITAAMPEGTGLAAFAARFPGRFYDVGICEQHAVTFAAGLATQGIRPVVAIYSTFLQRAYDQVVHDVCLQNLPVIFALDRAGLVGEDGPTHHGVFDIAYLRHIPNMSIIAPRGRRMMLNAMATAMQHKGPIALRYPKGECLSCTGSQKTRILTPGKGEVLRQGESALAVIAVGNMARVADLALQEIEKELGISITLFDPVWLKPMPEKQILGLAGAHSRLLVIEEHVRSGGFGSAVLELLSDKAADSPCRVSRHALPDEFCEHGAVKELHKKLGFDLAGIKKAILKALPEEERK